MGNTRLHQRVFTSPNSNDSQNLDLLRAVAVSCVLLSHFASALGYNAIGSLGRFGVVLFFVHTTFVLMASLDRTGGDAVSFATRRFFRVFPLAIFCILAVPVFHIPVGPGVAYSWIGAKHFLANLALAQNLFYSPSILGPLWSLPLEVQMYCFLPALYLVARRNVRWAVGIWCTSVLCALTLPRVTGRADLFSYAPCFASGILAYAVTRAGVKVRFPAAGWVVSIIGCVLLFHPFDDTPLTSKLPLAWSLSLVLGLAIPFTHELRSRPLHSVTHLIAKYSYGLYLTHIVVLWIVMDVLRGDPGIVRISVLLAGLVGLPVLLFHAIENPMIHLGRRLSQRKESTERQAAGQLKSFSQAV